MAAYVFAEKFVPDKFVLDNGSGSGYGANHLKNRGAKKVVGVDIAEDAVAYANQRYGCENLEFQVINSTNLTFPDQTFDVVVSFQVIEHLREPGKFLSHITRVLKNSGVALISTLNKQTYSPHIPGPLNPFHFKEYYLDEFSDLLQRYFDEVEVFGVTQSARAAEFRKAVRSSLAWRAGNILKKIHPKILLFLLRLMPEKVKARLNRPSDKRIDSSDFAVTKLALSDCLDFIAVCRKSPVPGPAKEIHAVQPHRVCKDTEPAQPSS